MKRVNVLKQVIQKQEEVIENIKKSILIYRADADLDEEDTMDPDDFSHQSESKEMQLRFEQHLKDEKQKLNVLQNELEGKNSLRIIESENHVILLGLSIPLFKYNKSIIGISEDAPIYKSLLKLSKGDKLKLGTTSEKIEDIY